MASLVLVNARVASMELDAPSAEAVAVRGDRILAVGTEARIRGFIGDETRVLDMDGQFVMPGFIDSHTHFMWLGDAKLQTDLSGAEDWDEVVARIAAVVETSKPGELIQGVGWHQEKWSTPPSPSVKGFPVHADLSAVSPENPVVLTHASSHGAFANERAMQLAGIDAASAVPEGGEMVVGPSDGQPTGMFLEHAQDMLRVVVPAKPSLSVLDVFPGEELARRRVELAGADALQNGVTTVHEAGTSLETVEFYKKLVDEGTLPVRLWVMLSETNDVLREQLPNAKLAGYGDSRLTVGAIKRVLDGALGSRGAWLLEPYADLPSTSGLNTEPLDRLGETARIAAEHGMQLAVHAIGSRANRETLDLYESFLDASDDRNRRWRIEHAQHIHPDDVSRFAELGVIASMQSVHCLSDAVFVPTRLGEERAVSQSYLWRSLVDSGAVVVNGTDAPVEDINPIPTFYAAVTRKLSDGSRFGPSERLTREQALHSYTLGAAYAAFEEDMKGSLAPGKLADIVVLSKDLLKVPEDEILSTTVVMTILGGEIVYEALAR